MDKLRVSPSPGAIHPSAVVSSKARIAAGVEIGPSCVIGPEVEIGSGTRLLSHVVVDGRTTIGEDNFLYPGVCIGFPAQAKNVPDPGLTVLIGRGNVFREYVTVHAPMKNDGHTTVGDHCLFMVGSHVGHDGKVGNDVVLANQTALGGHVIVEDNAVIGGLVGVHQYCRVGKYAMVGGLTKTTQDVLPFTTADGRPARLSGVNSIGLKRGGFSRSAISDLHRAIRLIRSSGAKFRETLEALSIEFKGHADVEYLIRFIGESKRGVIRRPIGGAGDEPGL